MKGKKRLRAVVRWSLIVLLWTLFLANGHAGDPSTLMEESGVDERLGTVVPGDLVFEDHRGRSIEFGAFLNGNEPTILVFAYYHCPMLCDRLVAGLVAGLGKIDFRIGRDYRVITVGIDPEEKPKDASRKRSALLQQFRESIRDEDFPFVVGTEREVGRLANAVGFRYRYDPKTNQYVHPAVIMILSPEGKISRYLYGVEFEPSDLRLGLVEAGEGKIGSTLDRVILTCYRYDPAKRRYGPYVLGFIRLGSLLILGIVAGGLFVLFRRERRTKRDRG